MGFVANAIGSIAQGFSGAAGIGDTPNSPVTSKQLGDIYGRTQTGQDQQEAFVKALQDQDALHNQSHILNQQQLLADQLNLQGLGQGPNPAQAALNQSTGQNIAQQAALMAGQRGASANPALIARLAAMQGGSLQQQAIGQAATMQAQQQMAAREALARQQASMASTTNQQVSNQGNALNSYAQNVGNQYGQALGSQTQIQAGSNSAKNGSIAGIAGGLMSGISGAVGSLFGGGSGPKAKGSESTMSAGGGDNMGDGSSMNAAHGGMIPQYADGGMAGPQSFMGQYLAQRYAQGGPIMGEALASQGMRVPGKATVSGDSLKNDNVKALLSPGEIVIPRSIAMGDNAPDKAAKFVAAVLAKQGMKK